VPLLHQPLLQSPSIEQLPPSEHSAQTEPPQSTSLSSWFRIPSLQLTQTLTLKLSSALL
jgi:hypothetical protein